MTRLATAAPTISSRVVGRRPRARRSHGVRGAGVRRDRARRRRAHRPHRLAERAPLGAGDGRRRAGVRPRPGPARGLRVPDGARRRRLAVRRAEPVLRDGVGSYAAEELPSRMARVLAEGTGAEWSQVWLVVGDRPRLAATWPPEATRERAAGDAGDPVEDEVAGRRSLEVRHGGEVLGVLVVQEREHAPAHDGRGTPVRGVGQAGGSGPARGPAARGARAAAGRAVGASRRAARVARAAGRPAGRRAPAARARHPRRRPAAPGRARREPAPRPDPGRRGRRNGRTPSWRARSRPPSTPSTPWCTSPAASTRRCSRSAGSPPRSARRSSTARSPCRSIAARRGPTLRRPWRRPPTSAASRPSRTPPSTRARR